LSWYDQYSERVGLSGAPAVGILFARHYWVNGHLQVENSLIEALESEGLRVIPAFSYSVRDEGLGAGGSGEVVKEWFLCPDGESRIHAMVKLQSFFLGRVKGDETADTGKAAHGVELLKRLNVPVFQPIVSYYKSVEEWEDEQELAGDIGWSIAMPEFEGVVEPLFIGALKKTVDAATNAETEERVAIRERCLRLAARVKRWVALGNKPIEERKVAFILHNNPCASVEATVGSASNLDSLESVARILQSMAREGYRVNAPESGEQLIETIMERKAVAEFRWTTVEEIVKKNGALALLSLDDYLKWWETFPEKARERIRSAWGNPPGEAKDGVPAAMVYQDRLVITGVRYGNAVVCVQPKRGCAGPRCDGQVCKILHDPKLPPPHQYLATYRYLETDFPADVIVHVGTHGNIEWLPGKGVGLSAACMPDLALHEVPHLYIYNADNPPEGIIAKRRGYATLVDHMQTVLSQSGLYDSLEELARTLGEYEQAKLFDRNRAHVLQHLIVDLIKQAKLDHDAGIKHWLHHDSASENHGANDQHDRRHGSVHVHFDQIAKVTHEALSRIQNSQVQDGMHIFGDRPENERRIDFLHSILRYDAGEKISPRKLSCSLMGLELQSLLADAGAVHPDFLKSYGELLTEAENLGKEIIRRCLKDPKSDLAQSVRDLLGARFKCDGLLAELPALRERILDVNSRIEASKEIPALLSGFSGEYIPAGPSGLITRGRDDVLPTGRNFYSLDPERVPSKAAYRVGERLAEALLEKHMREEGRLPENVAIYWMCADIMWSDGEGMAQILNLLGVRPRWLPNGRVGGFDIIPQQQLGRPRIDVTLRISGITRDNFPNCIAYVDEAIQAVAALDEPPELNFIRKHSLWQIEENGEDAVDPVAWRKATLRLFASPPGTYRPGVNLAVYASAWKEEKDLADIFLYWNGYAYGKDIHGEASHAQLANSMKTVDVTFNKVVSDEHDLFGCCCYFGTHGGMTAAARSLSGKEVKTYYGDTREPEHVEVRDLADEIRRVVRTKLLNPKWIEGMKRHGYKGAGDISKRVGRVYGWESTTQEVDDWIFDDITRTFILDAENRGFFEQHNPWAMEEIARRLLEAESRGLWQADPKVLEELRQNYLEIEGLIEERMGDIDGEFQGGSVDIFSADDVPQWQEMMRKMNLI
ncbi:MAG: cobaltochelatase subunit CobN, partial [Desulforhabdus sp.]|nr:cobaltochelatase subunit CobN [Desulforhabdus sp.]